MGIGAVACGHPATAEAALEILQDGGNAFDASLAAMCAASIAEPVLCSLGGGGFLLAQPEAGEARLYDFFVQTPKQNRPLADIDFHPAVADFGTATQEFHIGLGSIATPGAIRGLFAIHRDLASLPLKRIIEPAVRLAHDGVKLRAVDGYLFQVVGAILTDRSDSRGHYLTADGRLLGEGDLFKLEDLATVLESLAAEGEELFYRGDLGREVVKACREQGGLLTEADLESYRAVVRRPLGRSYRHAAVLTNPAPSTGGLLIAFALDLLSRFELDGLPWGSPECLSLIARVMSETNHARVESHLNRAVGEAAVTLAADQLLAPDLLETYAQRLLGRPRAHRGTTHVSIIDRKGSLASLSLSNGEGCGFILPGTGIMLNNMLGEEDLNPQGFGLWPADTRLASMMSPTIASLADGSQIALGSGGSNRIRSAILQTLLHLIDYRTDLDHAVKALRLHYERGVLNLEDGLGAGLDFDEIAETVKHWPPHNLFFGGVHGVMRRPDGTLSCAGDPRRGGAALLA